MVFFLSFSFDNWMCIARNLRNVQWKYSKGLIDERIDSHGLKNRSYIHIIEMSNGYDVYKQCSATMQVRGQIFPSMQIVSIGRFCPQNVNRDSNFFFVCVIVILLLNLS